MQTCLPVDALPFPAVVEDHRLDSWKQIATFFNKEVRTVQLWEKREGLPVRRHHHSRLGSIYAYRHELELWWKSRGLTPEKPRPLAAREEGETYLAKALQRATQLSRITLLPCTVEHEQKLAPLQSRSARAFLRELEEQLFSQLTRSLWAVKRTVSAPNTSSTCSPRDEDSTGPVALTSTLQGAPDSWRLKIELRNTAENLCIWEECLPVEAIEGAHRPAMLAAAIVERLQRAAPSSSRASASQEVPSRQRAEYACCMGTHFWKQRRRSSLLRAVRYFQDALLFNPRCAQAYAGLVDCYVTMSYLHLISPAKVRAQSIRLAQIALHLDGNSVGSRNTMASVLLNWEWDWAGAERWCSLSISEGEADSRTFQLHAIGMTCQGRHSEAVNAAKLACAAESSSAVMNRQIALAFYHGGDFQNALHYGRLAAKLEPAFAMGKSTLGLIEAQHENWGEAIAHSHDAIALSRRAPYALANAAYIHARAADPLTSRQLMQELEASEAQQRYPYFEASAVYAALGDTAHALGLLTTAYKKRDMRVIYLRRDPRLQSLHGKHEFKQLTSALRLT